MKRDTYQTVTDKIILALENGVKPWQKPWAAPVSVRPMRANGQPYKGINVLLLWSAAQTKGYAASTWMTYKQAVELGGQVRKGERSEMVVFFKMLVKEAPNATTNIPDEKRIPMLREYSVFNVEQIDGLPERFYAKATPALPRNNERIPEADAFFAATQSTVNHGGTRAFYQPATDRIQMPELAAFDDSQHYYATLAHEHIHWTKAEKRLDREDFGRKRWGDEGYAMEELVAELGACFVAADLGIANDLDHSAAYLDSWLKVMKADKKAIFTASSHAQKAADFLAAFSAPAVTETNEAMELA